jgi:hypothetical protein
MTDVSAALRSSLCPKHRLLVVCRRFPKLKADSPRGASGQAISKSVAIALFCQPCLPCDHFDRSLVTRRGAHAAAVALFFIYFYYSSAHIFSPSKVFFIFHLILWHYYSIIISLSMLNFQQKEKKF